MRDSTIEEDCQQSVQQTLLSVLDASVRMLHPFMPFITEEIWRKIAEGRSGQSIMFESFADDFDPPADDAVSEINWIKTVISSIRNLRSENNIKPGERIVAMYQHGSEQISSG